MYFRNLVMYAFQRFMLPAYCVYIV